MSIKNNDLRTDNAMTLMKYIFGFVQKYRFNRVGLLNNSQNVFNIIFRLKKSVYLFRLFNGGLWAPLELYTVYCQNLIEIRKLYIILFLENISF